MRDGLPKLGIGQSGFKGTPVGAGASIQDLQYGGRYRKKHHLLMGRPRRSTRAALSRLWTWT